MSGNTLNEKLVFFQDGISSLEEDLAAHEENASIHANLNDAAISTQTVWSSQKIRQFLEQHFGVKDDSFYS